jgi:hypothetical protein
MVRIKAIVTIDKMLTVDSITVHEGYEELKAWECCNATTEAQRDYLAKKFAKLNSESKALEVKYQYPQGSLEGIHIIMGSSTGLIKQLPKAEFRRLLTDPRNVFIVKIRQGDRIIRTSIHTVDRIHTWEHLNSDNHLFNWPKFKRLDKPT